MMELLSVSHLRRCLGGIPDGYEGAIFVFYCLKDGGKVLVSEKGSKWSWSASVSLYLEAGCM
eukprot:2099545-Ditylum_brightwellii.AAC.1